MYNLPVGIGLVLDAAVIPQHHFPSLIYLSTSERLNDWRFLKLVVDLLEKEHLKC